MRLPHMTKEERKKCIKNVEKHLRNYNNYKISLSNLERQLSIASSDNPRYYSPPHSNKHSSEKFIKSEIEFMKMLIETIDKALTELSDIEREFVQYRYFNKWTVNKTALEMGYSEKAIFTIRNQVMDKLIIGLGSLSFMQ